MRASEIGFTDRTYPEPVKTGRVSRAGILVAACTAALLVPAASSSATTGQPPAGLVTTLGAAQGQIHGLQTAVSAVLGVPVPAVAFAANADWTILRNQPIGLAIGNAHIGWAFDPSEVSGYGYTAGLVHGDFEGCAWTATGNLGGSLLPINSGCAGFDPPVKSFTSSINCVLCSGGTGVRLIRNATEFANYRAGRGPINPVHRMPAGHCVEWRYTTLDGSRVMVKDRSWANNLASWVFVERSALPPQLPHNGGNLCSG